MNRLTKKFNGEYYLKNATTIIFNSELEYKAIQKLGKLEDLADQLGCPLEVLIKGFIESNQLEDRDFKQKIITYNCKCDLIEGFEMELSYGTNIDIAVDGVDNNNDYDIETITVQIKDYGKTWALTKEELL